MSLFFLKNKKRKEGKPGYANVPSHVEPPTALVVTQAQQGRAVTRVPPRTRARDHACRAVRVRAAHRALAMLFAFLSFARPSGRVEVVLLAHARHLPSDFLAIASPVLVFYLPLAVFGPAEQSTGVANKARAGEIDRMPLVDETTYGGGGTSARRQPGAPSSNGGVGPLIEAHNHSQKICSCSVWCPRCRQS